MSLISGEAFIVAGIPGRTSNQIEISQNPRIPQLWARLRTSDELASVPNRTDTNIIALYTDYERGADGEYTYILGVKVSRSNYLPDGMILHHVPAGEFLVFTSEQGPAWEVVPALWRKIWQEPQLQPGGAFARSFASDFEVYDHRAVNPHDCQVDLYIGVSSSHAT